MILASCGKSKTAEEYLRDARASRDSNNVPAAIINLKNALQQDAKNLDARVLLAQSYIDLGDGGSAEAEANHAKQDGADAIRIGTTLAEAELIEGKAAAALSDGQPPEGAPPALEADLAGVRARALLALGRFDEARDTLTAGEKSDPRSLKLQFAGIVYALSQRDIAAARERVTKAQAEFPNDARLIALHGAVDFADAKYEDAEREYKRASEAQSWNVALRLEVVRAQIAEGKLTEADANLDTILKSSPKNPSANYLRALSAYRAKNYESALNYSESILALMKDSAPTLLIAGSSAYARNQFDKASAYLGRYVFLVPANTQARKLLASAELQVGRAGDAVKTLSPAVAQANDDGDAQLLAMIGNAAARSGNLAEANRYLTMAVEKQPENTALRTELGATKISLGQTDAGIEELERAAREDPKAQSPEIALLLAYLRNKDYDKALEIAEQLKQQHPDDAIGYDFTGAVNLLKGEDQAAETDLLKARELHPGDAMALANLGALAIKNKKLDTAVGYYQEILKADPKNSRASLSLAQVQSMMGKAGDAEATLKNAVQQTPDDPAPRIVLARAQLVQGKNQDALDTIGPLLANAPQNPDVLEVVGHAQLGLLHFDQAIAAFKTLASVVPDSAAAHRYAAEAYAVAQNNDGAVVEARKAVELDPKDGSAKILLARLLLAQKNYDEVLVAQQNQDEALRIVDELEKQYPESPEVADLDGLIAMQQRRPQDAASDFQRALKLNDNSTYRGQLAMAQSQMGQLDEAEKTLKPWIETHPDDKVALLAMVDVYRTAKKGEEAVAAARQALQRYPNDPGVKAMLARTLVAVKQYDEARKLTDELANDNPKNPDIAFLAGALAEAQNRIPDAVAAFDRAMRLADTAQVRARLASVQMKAGRPQDALATLKAWTDGHPDDFAIRVILGDTYLTLNRAEDARSQYTDALRHDPNSAVVENNLAYALLQLGQSREALPHARHAVMLAPQSPQVLDTLGDVLLENHNTGEALQTLQNAARLAPDNGDIEFHLARALADSGKKDEARGMLRSLIDTNKPFTERQQAQKMLTALGG